jgi:hypothetical protein
MDLKQSVSGIVLTKTCKVKEDKDSATSKTITLRVKFDGVTLGDVFEKAMSETVIAWQAKARKEYEKLKDHSTVDVAFSAPARTQVDPFEYVLAQAKAAGMTPQDWLKAEAAKRVAPTVEQPK